MLPGKSQIDWSSLPFFFAFWKIADDNIGLLHNLWFDIVSHRFFFIFSMFIYVLEVISIEK
jgi:hypothetical protein